MEVAIVIPAHNECETIEAVVAGASPYGTVVVVDDGSSDGTADNAGRAGAAVVSHGQNRGYDAALQSGFEEADRLGAEIVVTLDADGQHDPAVLGDVLEPLRDRSADLVLGVRPAPARFAEWIFNGYVRMRYGVPDILCGLKGYRMDLYREHGRFDGTRSVGTELALAGLARGVATSVVPVRVSARSGGTARFGSALHANLRILRALGLALWAGRRVRSER